MTLDFNWDSNTLREGDRASVQADLEAEIPNACEYFGIDSAPMKVALSVERGNSVVRGVVTDGVGAQLVLLRYHLGSTHTATYHA